MNRPPDRTDLLDDVLAEAAPADFRAALLGETLRLARGRRRARQVRRVAVGLVAVALVVAAMWRNFPPRHTVLPAAAAGYAIVHTQPLPASAVIGTQPFGADRMVSSVATIGVIRTEPGAGDLRLVNDDELLALAAPWPAALVRVGPHAEELIFVQPAETAGPPVN